MQACIPRKEVKMNEHPQLDKQSKEFIISRMKTHAPYWALLGMELVDLRKGWAKVRLPYSDKLIQPFGVVHGGAIFSVADSSVAMALLGLVKDDEVFTTVEMKINYLKPFTRGEAIAEASIIHKGSRIALGDVEVRDANSALIAKAVSTYIVMKKRSEPLG